MKCKQSRGNSILPLSYIPTCHLLKMKKMSLHSHPSGHWAVGAVLHFSSTHGVAPEKHKIKIFRLLSYNKKRETNVQWTWPFQTIIYITPMSKFFQNMLSAVSYVGKVSASGDLFQSVIYTNWIPGSSSLLRKTKGIPWALEKGQFLFLLLIMVLPSKTIFFH